jgi:hypothetical protein
VSKNHLCNERRRQKEGGEGGREWGGNKKNYLCKEEFMCLGMRVKKRNFMKKSWYYTQFYLFLFINYNLINS